MYEMLIKFKKNPVFSTSIVNGFISNYKQCHFLNTNSLQIVNLFHFITLLTHIYNILYLYCTKSIENITK